MKWEFPSERQSWKLETVPLWFARDFPDSAQWVDRFCHHRCHRYAIYNACLVVIQTNTDSLGWFKGPWFLRKSQSTWWSKTASVTSVRRRFSNPVTTLLFNTFHWEKIPKHGAMTFDEALWRSLIHNCSVAKSTRCPGCKNSPPMIPEIIRDHPGVARTSSMSRSSLHDLKKSYDVAENAINTSCN